MKKAKHECKNCSTPINGQYCHFCGQRYHDHKESFGELVYEFVSDFLHFDSRFFKTILPLIFQPGKLTKSYNEGRQRSQFHPIRLYLFSSFVYFFLFFYFNKTEDNFENENNTYPVEVLTDSANLSIGNDSSSLLKMDTLVAGNKINSNTSASGENSGTDRKEFVNLGNANTKYKFTVGLGLDSLLQKRTTPEEYLNHQKTLPNDAKDGYLERIITAKVLKINLKGEEVKKEFIKKLVETFLHNIPKMLFFLLPLYAFFLKLLYFRKKEFYYVDHAIFSLHFFSLIFILLIVSNYILDKIFGTAIFSTFAFVWINVYLLVAMKRLYQEKWGRTVLKFVTLGFLFAIAIVITLLGNMAWTALMV